MKPLCVTSFSIAENDLTNANIFDSEQNNNKLLTDFKVLGNKNVLAALIRKDNSEKIILFPTLGDLKIFFLCSGFNEVTFYSDKKLNETSNDNCYFEQVENRKNLYRFIGKIENVDFISYFSTIDECFPNYVFFDALKRKYCKMKEEDK